MPQILTRSGPLPATHAKDGQKFEYGHIYIAPPDYHLLLEEQRTVLWRGPKENRFRPAVNALFRSAAATYRDRVTGVILSGALDDGSAGLWWVARYGGVAVVQDPDEAKVPEMPSNAIEHVNSARVLRLSEMGKVVTALANGEEVRAWERKRA